jgi:hypothetical protein
MSHITKARAIGTNLGCLTAALTIAMGATNIAAAAGNPGDVNLKWRDAATVLGANGVLLLEEPNDGTGQFVLAKVVVANTAAANRDIECVLQATEFGNTLSLDRARVRLASGSVASPAKATVTLQIAFEPSSVGGTGAILSCRVTSAGNNGVTAEWAKMTTHFVTGDITSVSQ